MQDDREDAAEENQTAPKQAKAEPDAAAKKQQVPRVAPSVKPGLLTKAWQACCAPFANIRLPVWNLRLFAWLLLALIVLVVLLSNWAPMRFRFFGLHVEGPKALIVIILLAIGFLVGWLSRSPRQERED